MNQPVPNDREFRSRIQRSTRILALWTLAWVVTTAIIAFGPKFVWHGDRLWTILALALNLIVGAAMIIANKNHFADMDELQRKVHLDASGITLGVALVAGIGYSMMDSTNLISWDAEIAHLIILMSLTFMTSIIVGQGRYR